MEKRLKYLFSLRLLFILFFIVFVFMAVKTMITVPFYDFDEAHRAENAKRMKEYGSYFVPLTGSVFDRVEHLKIPLRENPDLHLYYHLERPPLIYDLMILSTTIFGSTEWTYRLPSFFLGMLTIFAFLFFAGKVDKTGDFAVAAGLLTLITSSDLWLSSQYAQLDTGITLFLFLSLLTLIFFCSERKNSLIFLSGIFLGLAALSKLQPVVILIFPLACLMFLKKLKISDLLRFIIGFLLIFLPWLIYLVVRFGLNDAVSIMPGFALTSAAVIDINHQAPIFWYLRWWWEVMRPGWTIFAAFLVYDLLKRNFTWQKIVLLSYILGGLFVFSLPSNKLWWYVLPLVPAVSFYIFLSVKDYLEKKNKIINLSFAIIVASLPAFMRVTNKLAMVYGIAVTIVVFLILMDKLSIKINLAIIRKNVFVISLVLSLIFFLLQFPEIVPYHRNTKEVAEYYKNLPGKKCLWLGDMPGEAVLFYSNAGEVPPLQTKDHSAIFTNCNNNYLITPDSFGKDDILFRRGNIRLYKIPK